MKIAQFKNIELDFLTIHDWDDDCLPDNYIRVSEHLDIEFVAYNNYELVKKEIAMIDEQIQTVQAAAHIKTSELEQRKAELLALPDLSE